jgi:hypothetical protein
MEAAASTWARWEQVSSSEVPSGTTVTMKVSIDMLYLRRMVVSICLVSGSVAAQEASPGGQQPLPTAQQNGWSKLPRMELERQFAGPLQDTIIQRWRDPVDGTICYIYLPITAQHSPPTQSGYVQYGANTIGSISCINTATGGASGSDARRKAAPAQRQ